LATPEAHFVALNAGGRKSGHSAPLRVGKKVNDFLINLEKIDR
jgi:hypothetical protein